MRRLLTVLILTAATVSAFAQGPYRSSITYDSYEGLVMAGYQGWFNTPGDGAGRNWHHYEKGKRFEPGWCTIDLWPEVDEYPQLYETAFRFEDGTPAFVPSPYDKSTVDVHFRWMKEYGLDGVFLQRFIAEIANSSGKRHFNKVMASAMECANKYDRAVAIMYDLSGMPANGPEILLKDIDALAKAHHLFDHEANPSYLYQNGKPLVTVWGVGFNDNRKYGFDECEKIIDGLKAKGYSVMIGVPTNWRTLTKDTLPDPRLHALIRKCDIVMPWFVGRYNERTYGSYKSLIRKDMAWAEKEGIAYAPLCFPGFSWANMQRLGRPGIQIPRNGGSFFKKQLDYCLDSGAKMLYIAMFDEIDEGTAIFKIARKVPVAAPGSTFVPLEDGIPSDRYLTLAGEAAARLKGKPAAQNRHGSDLVHPEYEGLVMAGYQGWFHLPRNGVMYPDENQIHIDMWPDVSEYENTYPTGLRNADGSTARFFCSDDEQTVRTHFRWMQEYGLDGVFLQRFYGSCRPQRGTRKHSVTVLRHAMAAAQEYDRAFAVMYDLSGLSPEREETCDLLQEDWKFLVDSMKVTSYGKRNEYLGHLGKPLVVIWGVGFPDRTYDIRKIKLAELIDFLHNDPDYGGCTVMLGIPTYWRDLCADCTTDPYLHTLIRMADLVLPWMVQRFTPLLHFEMNRYRDHIVKDTEWCERNGVGYVPLVYPGFSWYNLSRGGSDANDIGGEKPLASIPRQGGKFYWDQIYTAVGAGAKMLYVAMFDEVNEGTAIFKCTDTPPVSDVAKFVDMDGQPSDHYLFLTGEGARMLRGERPLEKAMPRR